MNPQRRPPARGRPLLRLAAVCAAVLGLACTGTSLPQAVNDPDTRSRDTPLQAFQRTLDRRAAALLEGDPAGYLEGLTARAKRVERAIAEGAVNVPLALIDPAIRTGNVNQAQTEMNDVRTDLIFEYEGLPEDNPFRIRIINDLAEQDGAWRVTSSTIDADEAVPPMWAMKEVETSRSQHFLALFSPGLPQVDEILDLAEAARANLEERMSIPADSVHLVQLARNTREYRELLGPPDPNRPATSVAVARSEFSALSGVSNLPVNRLMIVDLEATLGDIDKVSFEKSTLYPSQVFQHELAHLLLSRYSRPETPAWVAEGAAQYLADERRPEWQIGHETGRFNHMTIEALTRKPDPPLNGFDYAFANAAVLYLVEEFGEATFFEFYKGFKNYETTRSTSMAGRRVEAVQGLLRVHYDISDDDLTRATRVYIRKAVG